MIHFFRTTPIYSSPITNSTLCGVYLNADIGAAGKGHLASARTAQTVAYGHYTRTPCAAVHCNTTQLMIQNAHGINIFKMLLLRMVSNIAFTLTRTPVKSA